LIEQIAFTEDSAAKRALLLAKHLQLELVALDKHQSQLWVSDSCLSLNIPELGNPFLIDFTSGKYHHRRQFGGGRGQPLAKAIGLKQGQSPTVIDATAGFARDSFVLASLGCEVMMLEQQPIMAALIDDAVSRARQVKETQDIAQRLNIQQGNAIVYLNNLTTAPDVIYLDPMYPSRDKSALVKKDMQLLHKLAGEDISGAELLKLAKQTAKKRVVVKRPKGAPYLGDDITHTNVQSKNTRYDIYPLT
jgi:16S rRNA (guanine1516-N2)-methyltransferase